MKSSMNTKPNPKVALGFGVGYALLAIVIACCLGMCVDKLVLNDDSLFQGWSNVVPLVVSISCWVYLSIGVVLRYMALFLFYDNDTMFTLYQGYALFSSITFWFISASKPYTSSNPSQFSMDIRLVILLASLSVFSNWFYYFAVLTQRRRRNKEDGANRSGAVQVGKTNMLHSLTNETFYALSSIVSDSVFGILLLHPMAMNLSQPIQSFVQNVTVLNACQGALVIHAIMDVARLYHGTTNIASLDLK